VAEVVNAAEAVNALSDRFWEGILDLSPTMATVLGYPQGMDRLDDPGPAGRDKARRLFQSTIAAADGIEAALAKPEDLPVEERITLDTMRVICEVELEQQTQRVDRLKVVDQMEGPQTILPQLAAFQPTATPAQLDAFLARLADYPRFMAANSELVREGLAAGLTAARIVAERTIGQLERVLAASPEDSPIVAAMPHLSLSDRDRVVAAVRNHVRPADAGFLQALSGDYRKATRTEPGLCSAPNGEELYRTQVRYWTSLDLDPADLHRIGLEELAAIEAERRVIARGLGFGDDTKAARAALTTDPKYVPPTVDALLERARSQIARAMAQAPRYFGNLPRAGCEVWPVESYKEADAPAAYYYAPAVDGSRPGIYYVNTYDLPSRNYVKIASTSFHEAVPGHHFQIALQAEHPTLNVFRRQGARMAGMAYVEGWGLYAERLADEMGLYLDEAERFGMLDGQSFRAARLVVDTGIHAFRWNRERAIKQMADAGVTETESVIETDRYICWPGQALAYKTGQREIERLRADAQARLGSSFDIRAFHDALLGHGTLPLATLSKELPRWLGIA
jgi:uncharacterized protein (DUF885 family)